MKKRMFCCVLCIVSAMLASCEVHWGEKSADVPWWLIVIPTVAFLIVVLYFVGKRLSSMLHVCPRCQKAFIPNGGRLPLRYIKTERECCAVRIVKQRAFAAYPTKRTGMHGE